MATPITETSAFGATVTAADDGDDETAASLVASGVGLQELANRTRFFYDTLLNGAQLPVSVRSTDGVTVDVTHHSGLIAGSKRAAHAVTGTYTVTPTVAASTWYYLYVTESAGVPTFEVSTTAPTPNLVHKTADTTRLYITCFVTDGAGVILPFTARLGQYVYQVSARTDSIFAAYNALPADTAAHAVDLSALVPPHARVVTLRGTVTAAGAWATGFVRLFTTGDTGLGQWMEPPVRGGACVARETFPLVLAAQQISYQATTAMPALSSVTLEVVGFAE